MGHLALRYETRHGNCRNPSACRPFVKFAFHLADSLWRGAHFLELPQYSISYQFPYHLLGDELVWQTISIKSVLS